MKQQSWAEIFGSIFLKIGLMLLKLLVFILWIIGSALETLLHDVNISMKKFLFPNRN